MIRVTITNLKTNQVGWGSDFLAPNLANQWIAEAQAGNWWGLSQRTLTAKPDGTVVDTDGSTPDLTKAISSTAIVDVPAVIAVQASYSGQLAGAEEGSAEISVRAVTAGAAGNHVHVAYDGVETLQAGIDAWNTANPDNQVTLLSGDGTQVPMSGLFFNLLNGVDGVPAVTHMQYVMPAQYSIAQADITNLVANQDAIQKGLQCQTVGATCVAQVYALNEAKFTAGTLTTQDFQTILADQTLLTIERLLWNGSLATAKAMIQAYTSPYFTSDDIASIVAIIDGSGLLS